MYICDVKNTKEIILNTALVLFNTYGLSKVSLRTIANEMGISQGNLNYHFKKRDTIIEALYFQLVIIIDESMAKNKSEEVNLQVLYNASTTIMKNFFDYRFFLLDFVQIIRENKVVKNHYSKLIGIRQEQFMSLFHALIEKDIMRKEILPNEYLFLYNRFQILGDFWISSAKVTNAKITEKTVSEYTELIHQAIFPYLTNKGVKEYYTIFPK